MNNRAEKYAQLRAMIPEMRRVRRIHFVGIGGAGMGALPRFWSTKVIRSVVRILPKMP